MLRVGQILGDFTIVRFLGRGGMGEVYEARQGNPDRLVALKVLAADLATSDDARRRFEGEIAVLAKLNHPHIVPVYAGGRSDDGRLYYAMRLILGPTLARFLQLAAVADPGAQPERRTLPRGLATPSEETTVSLPDDASTRGAATRYRHDRFAWAIDAGVAVAEALAHAHRAGVLHRDVKPSNLMLDAEGRVVVVDFGLHQALGPDGDHSQGYGIRGTPWYMSPEQARGEPLDGRSDVYALGKTLYEVVAGGQGPYATDRNDRDAVLAQVRSGALRPLRPLAPGLPDDLEAVILRCLEADPARRWQSAQELAAALRALRKPVPAADRPAAPGRWKAAVRVLVAAGLLVALGAALADYSRPGASGQADAKTPPEPTPGPVQPRRVAVEPGYPDALLHRKPGLPVHLQRITGEPVWLKPVLGPGKTHLFDGALCVTAPPPKRPSDRLTLFALDDDPLRRPYEFAVEVVPMTARDAKLYALGVFFGRRDPHAPFVLVELSGVGPARRLRVGSARVFPADAVNGDHLEGLAPFLPHGGDVALPGEASRHLVKLLVHGDRVKVGVDDRPPLEFDFDQIRRATNDPILRAALRADGAVGVWVSHGVGRFQNARVTSLEPDP